MIEHVLNMQCFKLGNAQTPYFVFAFADYVLQSKLPRGYKLKFSKFAGELEESTMEHVAHFQIEFGDLSIDEILKIKNFPCSLTKNAFTWFTTLPPKSIYTWIQLKRVFQKYFFRGETKGIME